MLPLQIQKRLASPGKLENEFLNYLRKANAPIDQSKTIAYNVLYDTKETTEESTVDLFTGTFNQALTNIEGSYIRPASEHFLIYGIRGYVATKVDLPLTNNALPMVRGFTNSNNFVEGTIQPYVNAQLSLQVNSVRLNKYIPLTEFDNTETAGNRGTMFLDQPILWQGQTELKATIETNDPSINFPGSVTDANGSFIRLDLFGLALI
jgi:hypothetical protein